MTDDQLRKGNEIKKEILNIEDFLFYADRVWTGKIIKRTSKFIITSCPYGTYNEAEYHLDTETKDKMLDVLRKRLFELKKQLTSI